jgi:hypothetical protein
MSQLFRRPAWRVWLLLIVMLTGCQADEQAAARAVEAYLQARVESNVERMAQLSCPAWEAQARVEAASFQAMNAALEGVACAVSGSDGRFTLVACSGKITTTYQGEAREWNVGDQEYRTVNEGGEWRMCGYRE